MSAANDELPLDRRTGIVTVPSPCSFKVGLKDVEGLSSH